MENEETQTAPEDQERGYYIRVPESLYERAGHIKLFLEGMIDDAPVPRTPSSKDIRGSLSKEYEELCCQMITKALFRE